MPIPLEVEDAGPPTVAIRNLCVSRGSRPVLADLSCDIARGKITAIVGLNGCGKSTLLRTLVGEFRYTGTVRFACGEDHRKPRPDHVGYVPQRLSIETSLPVTVRDLIGLALQRRPIFLGDRLFALLGYELVEGTRGRGPVRETARIDFARPRDSRRG